MYEPGVAPIRTERLTLRPYRDGDDIVLHDLYRDPEVCRFLLHDPWTEQDAREALERRRRRTNLGDGSVNYLVETGGYTIGNVAAWFVEDSDHTVELGWVFAGHSGGRGYATESVGVLLGAVFSLERVHRVTARMDGRNAASARLAERLGMRREAHFVENCWSKGEWTDTVVYALLRRELSI